MYTIMISQKICSCCFTKNTKKLFLCFSSNNMFVK